ncbi:hypothetical protein COY62_04475 [bacterium (Candidatus Howlettbacteria) CG_4_10_14_0_8_um_filter_40_9]|nr:MAG: hypothetical protein COY62_04475 [bacterium (Candidatus Howlettbacteria) CG_4_10_14_0_8_um_filter_40_9]
MYKGLRLLILAVVLGVLALVPVISSAKPSAQGKKVVEASDESSTDIKTRREEIKEQIEGLKTKNAEKRAVAEELILTKVKQATIRAIDSTIKKLNAIKSRVAKMKNIAEELKTGLNEKIDARIAVLQEKMTAVEAATTKEEVKTALGESQKELRNTKDIIKSVVGAIHKTHLQNIIARLEKVLTKLEEKAANLMDTKKAEADTIIAQAKVYLEAAKTDIAGGNLTETKADIQKAHKEIVKLLSKVKVLKSTDSTEEEGSDD